MTPDDQRLEERAAEHKRQHEQNAYHQTDCMVCGLLTTLRERTEALRELQDCADWLLWLFAEHIVTQHEAAHPVEGASDA